RLLREFAMTIVIAVLISGFISQTLTPMLCARVLKAHDPNAHHHWLFNMIENGFNATKHGYDRSLAWVISKPRMTMIVFFAIIAATVVLINKTPKGFLPSDDSGQVI